MSYNKTRSSFLTASLLSIPILGLALGAQPASGAEQLARLSINLVAVKKPVGVLMVGIYDSPANFAADRPVKTVQAPAAGHGGSYSLSGLRPGRYAIKAFHDLNGDGRLNMNLFGVPTEPYAASGRRLSRLTAPSWEACAFDVSAGDNVQTIAID